MKSGKENNKDLPEDLITGIESLSGISMDDVKVHYNADRPKKIKAETCTPIHLQEEVKEIHPKEKWHLIQQKQGRVQPIGGKDQKPMINEEENLEKEADTLGAKAFRKKPSH